MDLAEGLVERTFLETDRCSGAAGADQRGSTVRLRSPSNDFEAERTGLRPAAGISSKRYFARPGRRLAWAMSSSVL